jgi:LPS-assembly lipoprotein
MTRFFLFAFLLSMTCLLSSCGFHLRGAVTLAQPLKTLYLRSQDPYGELSRNLKQNLKISGVHMVTSPEQATTILEIIHEEPSHQLLSVGGTQQTRQYNLILTVVFQITDNQGKILVPSQTVSESQALTVQANQELGGSNEENNLYRQMRRAIVYDIMNRLASDDIRKQITVAQPVRELQ